MTVLPTTSVTPSRVPEPHAYTTPEAKVRELGGRWTFYRHYTEAQFFEKATAQAFRHWLLARGGYAIVSDPDLHPLLRYCAIQLGQGASHNA